MSVIIEHDASSDLTPAVTAVFKILGPHFNEVTVRLMRGRNKPVEVTVTKTDIEISGAFDDVLQRLNQKLKPSSKGKMQISYEPGPDADPVQAARLREHLAAIG